LATNKVCLPRRH